MNPELKDLTIFWTCYSAYKYKMMPFRLINRLAIFQHYVNDLFLDYLDQFMTVFIDDILVYSENELEHKEHIIKVLNRLKEAGL